LAHFPQSAVLATNLGALIIEQLGRRGEGLTLMKRATELDTSNQAARRNLLAAEEMSKALEREIHRLRAQLTTRPVSASSWRAIGIAETRYGRLDAAEQAFRKALELEPQNPELAKYLQTVLSIKRQ
jgi:cytochrome c-type biogenesis protein CcmH/NrfG